MNRNNGIPGGKWQASASCLVAILALTIGIGDAFAGPRGGGSSGRMAQTSVSGASRATASSANRGNVNRGNANTGNVNRGNVNTGNVNRGNVNTGNVNTGNVNRGNVNTGNVNTGNINVGNDINVDIDRDYDHCCGWGGAYYHPVATGVVIGAVAVTTAAVVGSYYYSLPPTGCTTVIKNGVSYTQCGTVYYQKVMSGNDVVYMVVQP